MQRRGAVFKQGGQMFGGTIAFIGGQIILWIDRVPLADHGVASNFSNDRGGGDGAGKRVAVDDLGLRAVPVNANRIEQQVIGYGIELGDSFTHGQQRSVIDVDLIDAGYVHGGNGVRDG